MTLRVTPVNASLRKKAARASSAPAQDETDYSSYDGQSLI